MNGLVYLKVQNDTVCSFATFWTLWNSYALHNLDSFVDLMVLERDIHWKNNILLYLLHIINVYTCSTSILKKCLHVLVSMLRLWFCYYEGSNYSLHFLVNCRHSSYQWGSVFWLQMFVRLRELWVLGFLE